VEGAVASWLVCSTPGRAVGVRDLSWGHCVVFMGNRDKLASHPGGSRNTPSPFMLRKPG